MIGNLVVVKDNACECVGEVLDEGNRMLYIKVLHVKYIHPEYHTTNGFTRYWAYRPNIIKKSSRPVKMKQQLGLEEEQQPTTL